METLPDNVLRTMISREKLALTGRKMSRRAHVFIGPRCSYNCIFCYENGKRKEPFLSESQILSYIDFLNSYGIESIEYTGGEPTECEFLPEVMSFVKKKYKLGQSVITNGSADEEVYSSFIRSGVDEFLFSAHGYDERSHFLITCAIGSWERLINAMKFVDSFSSVKLRVNTTICKYNYLHLREQAEFFLKTFKNLFMINYLPMNSWDNSLMFQDISVPYRNYAEILKDAIIYLKENSDVKIAVRYAPYCCFPSEIHDFIYNHIHHVYDEYDWNQELDGKTIHKEYLKYPYGYFSMDSILNKRAKLYTKFKKCLSCKDFIVCDGFQKNQIKRENLYG